MKISNIQMGSSVPTKNVSFNASVIFDKTAIDVLNRRSMSNVREGFFYFQNWAKCFLNQDAYANINVRAIDNDMLILSSNAKGPTLEQPWVIDRNRDSIDVFKDLRTTVFEAFNHLTKDSNGKKIHVDINFKRTASAQEAYRYKEAQRKAAETHVEQEEWEPNSNYTGDYVHPTPLIKSDNEYELGII